MHRRRRGIKMPHRSLVLILIGGSVLVRQVYFSAPKQRPVAVTAALRLPLGINSTRRR
jgi:hypothetical protein